MKFLNTLLFVVLTFICSTIIGQTTVTIGTGTSTNYNYPFQPYFNYGWSDMIYSSSEIGTSGSITSLAFYVNNSNGTYTLDNQKIYLRQTSAIQQTDKYYPGTSGFTLVYDGSITFGASGWQTITLNTPFTYNNSSNLEVLVESRDGSTFTSGIQSRYTTKSEYRTKYDYNDYAFPTSWYSGGKITKLPNIQFVISNCSVTGGTVNASQSSVCPGGTTTLSLNGQTAGESMQWQESEDNITFTDITGATDSIYVASSLTATKYYRVVVGTGTCVANSSSQQISISTSPSAPTVSDNGPICIGSTLNLTASTIAGATYAWTGPNGFTSTSQNLSITNITSAGAGTYSVTATLNGCTSVAGTTSVTVNDFPSNVSISASATSVTSGTSVTLTASGAINYTWDNTLGTGAVKTVTPITSTTYMVVADNGNNCKDTTTITIDVTNSTNTGVTTSTVTIGTGTATDYSIPFQSYFNYGWSSQLYLANELQGTGFLNSLSFYVSNNGGSYTLENQKIYVRHTSEESFADKYYPGTTGFILVYDGPITFTSTGWKTINFTTSFNYNGTSNLEVLVESRDGSTFTSAVQTRYTNQSGTSIYRTKYDYNDYSFPSTYNQGGRIHHYANIQFNKTVCDLAMPVITTNSPVCEGSELRLSTDTIAGATYLWTGPNGFVSSEQNVELLNVLSNLSGDYLLNVTINNCSIKDSIEIIVHPKFESPIIKALSFNICPNEFLYLSTNEIDSLFIYQWQQKDTLDYIDITNSNRVDYFTNNLSTNTSFRLKKSNGQCSYYSDAIEINTDCLITTFIDSFQNRVLSINLNSVPNKIAPYYYFISDNPIPNFESIYSFYRDSLHYDSLQFLELRKNNTTFRSLISNSEKFILVYDSEGKVILKKYLSSIQNNSLLYSENIASKSNIFTSNSDTGKGLIGHILEENKVFRFQINDYTKLNFLGFQSSTLETISNENLQFGITNSNNTLEIIHNNLRYPLINLQKQSLSFEIYVKDSIIYYSVNNTPVYESPISYDGTDYTDVISLRTGGVFLFEDEFFNKPIWAEPTPFYPILPDLPYHPENTPKIYKYKCNKTIYDRSCTIEKGSIIFDFNQDNNYRFPIIEHIIVTNDLSQTIYYGNQISNLKYIVENLEVGTYSYEIKYHYNIWSSINYYDKGKFEINQLINWTKLNNTKYNSYTLYTNQVFSNHNEFSAISSNQTSNIYDSYYIDFTFDKINSYLYSINPCILRWSKTDAILVNEKYPSDLEIYNRTFINPYIYSNYQNFPDYPSDLPIPSNLYNTSIKFNNKEYPINNKDRFRYLYNRILNQLELYKLNIALNTYELIDIFSNYSPTNSNYKMQFISKESSAIGIKNCVTNMNCFPAEVYVKLERVLRAVDYIPTNGFINFIYDEEYDPNTNLKFTIKNSNLTTILSDQDLSLNREYGDNRYSINVSSFPFGHYILEVENNKNEKFYLRFKK